MADDNILPSDDTSMSTTASDTAAPAAPGDSGGRLRTLANGAVYDMERKRIVSGPTKDLYTSENAAAMRARYDEQRLRAKLAAQGALQGIATDKPGVLAGWRAIVRNQAEFAASERSLPAVAAARFVGAATGFIDGRGDSSPTPGSVTEAVGAAALAALLAVVRDRRAADGVIDAEFTE